MNITCDVIRDLLPLYAEDLVSSDSKTLVEGHLSNCENCTRQLGILKKAATIPVELDTGALKRVGNTIRRRRILAVLIAVLTAVTLFFSTVLLLDAKIYLTAEQAVKSVEMLEDESIRIHWSEDIAITGTCSLGYAGEDPDYDYGNYGIIVWAPLRNILFPREFVSYEEMMAQIPEDMRSSYPVTKESYNSKTIQLEGGAGNCNFWYCNAADGTGQTLLWDAGNPVPQASFAIVNYHLAYYCLVLICAAVLLAIPGRKWKGKWYGELCTRFSILFACLAVSTVIVSAGQFMELYDEFTINFINSAIVALPMTLTALFSRQLYLLNKQDRGEA